MDRKQQLSFLQDILLDDPHEGLTRQQFARAKRGIFTTPFDEFWPHYAEHFHKTKKAAPGAFNIPVQSLPAMSDIAQDLVQRGVEVPRHINKLLNAFQVARAAGQNSINVFFQGRRQDQWETARAREYLIHERVHQLSGQNPFFRKLVREKAPREWIKWYTKNVEKESAERVSEEYFAWMVGFERGRGRIIDQILEDPNAKHREMLSTINRYFLESKKNPHVERARSIFREWHIGFTGARSRMDYIDKVLAGVDPGKGIFHFPETYFETPAGAHDIDADRRWLRFLDDQQTRPVVKRGLEQSADDLTKINLASVTRLKRFAPYLLGAGIGVGAYLALSSKDSKADNVISGMPEGGWGSQMRQAITDFGSGYQGLESDTPIADIGSAARMWSSILIAGGGYFGNQASLTGSLTKSFGKVAGTALPLSIPFLWAASEGARFIEDPGIGSFGTSMAGLGGFAAGWHFSRGVSGDFAKMMGRKGLTHVTRGVISTAASIGAMEGFGGLYQADLPGFELATVGGMTAGGYFGGRYLARGILRAPGTTKTAGELTDTSIDFLRKTAREEGFAVIHEGIGDLPVYKKAAELFPDLFPEIGTKPYDFMESGKPLKKLTWLWSPEDAQKFLDVADDPRLTDYDKLLGAAARYDDEATGRAVNRILGNKAEFAKAIADEAPELLKHLPKTYSFDPEKQPHELLDYIYKNLGGREKTVTKRASSAFSRHVWIGSDLPEDEIRIMSEGTTSSSGHRYIPSYVIQERLNLQSEFRVITVGGKPVYSAHRFGSPALQSAIESLGKVDPGAAEWIKKHHFHETVEPIMDAQLERRLAAFTEKFSSRYTDVLPIAGWDVGLTKEGQFKIIEMQRSFGTYQNPIVQMRIMDAITGGKATAGLVKRLGVAGAVVAGVAATAALAFSGGREAHNTIEGMPEGGMASQMRRANTDFGSPFRGAIKSGAQALRNLSHRARAEFMKGFRQQVSEKRNPFADYLWYATAEHARKKFPVVDPMQAASSARQTNLAGFIKRLGLDPGDVFMTVDKPVKKEAARLRKRMGLSEEAAQEFLQEPGVSRVIIDYDKYDWMGRPEGPPILTGAVGINLPAVTTLALRARAFGYQGKLGKRVLDVSQQIQRAGSKIVKGDLSKRQEHKWMLKLARAKEEQTKLLDRIYSKQGGDAGAAAWIDENIEDFTKSILYHEYLERVSIARLILSNEQIPRHQIASHASRHVLVGEGAFLRELGNTEVSRAFRGLRQSGWQDEAVAFEVGEKMLRGNNEAVEIVKGLQEEGQAAFARKIHTYWSSKRDTMRVLADMIGVTFDTLRSSKAMQESLKAGRVVRQLGEAGKFGAVHEMETVLKGSIFKHLEGTKFTYARKELLPEATATVKAHGAQFGEAAERSWARGLDLRREASMLEAAKPLEGYVTTPYLSTQTQLYMEKIGGTTLFEAAQSGKDLPREMIPMLKKEAERLTKLGVYTGDTHAANVMMNEFREPVFIDFGLARQVKNQGRDLERMGMNIDELTAEYDFIKREALRADRSASVAISQAPPGPTMQAKKKPWQGGTMPGHKQARARKLRMAQEQRRATQLSFQWGTDAGKRHMNAQARRIRRSRNPFDID